MLERRDKVCAGGEGWSSEVHLARGFVVAAKAPDVAHLLVLVFLVGPCFVGLFLCRVPLHVLCRACASPYRISFEGRVEEGWEEVMDGPLTLASYVLGSRSINDAASPFKGSLGLGYRKSWGRKTSKMLMRSNIGDHVYDRELWDQRRAWDKMRRGSEPG